MLRNSLFGLILMLVSVHVLAQQSKVHLQAIPQQSVVLLDGDTLGSASDRTIYLGFNERKGIDSHTVVVAAPGYESFERTYDLSMPRDIAITVRLARTLPRLEEKPEERVDWRIVASGIPYGTELGAGTRWLYRFNKDVLDVQAKDELHEALVAMNMNLFDSLPNARELIEQGDSARYMFQGMVESYTLRRGLRSEDYSSYYKAYTATVSVRWQLVDRSTDSLLLDAPFASVYEYRGIATIGFHDAVVDNFFRFAQTDSSILEAFTEQEKPRPIEPIGRLEETQGDGDTSLDSLGRVVDADGDRSVDGNATTVSIGVDLDSTMATERDPEHLEEASGLRSGIDELPDQKETTAKDAISKSELRTIAKPNIQANERYANATVVGRIDQDDQLQELGVVLTKDGWVIMPSALPTGQTVWLRFSNGVELQAQVEASNASKNLSLLKLTATSLKPVLASNEAPRMDQNILIPRFEPSSKVGLQWKKCANASISNCLSETQASYVPVFNDFYQWLGFQSANEVLLDALGILNVFGFSYE